MRPRDNQRSRCYAWERAAAKHIDGRDFYSSEFNTLEECESFMRPIWRSERGRVGLAKHRAPELARNLWGQRRATAGPDNVIKLPRWARSRWVILHEMAHRLTPADEAHGPRFVGVLIGLVCRHMDYDASRLMQLADEMGVAYHVRSIGSVPVHGPSWHVERAVAKHGPLTAMDIACHLTVIEGADVTLAQVRGAALTLIRKGQAKWLRGKLHPIANGSVVKRTRAARSEPLTDMERCRLIAHKHDIVVWSGNRYPHGAGLQRKGAEDIEWIGAMPDVFTRLNELLEGPQC